MQDPNDLFSRLAITNCVKDQITITANGLEKNRMGQVHRLKPTRADAEKAVRTLIAWAGDPDREGLRETPVRVTRAYEEWFVGYDQNPEKMLRRTFGEVAGYDEMVTLRDIPFESFCEHHLAPITGFVHVGYLPNGRGSESRSLRGSWMHSLNGCKFRNA